MSITEAKPFNVIVVTSGRKMYKCLWWSNTVLKCGKCLKGVFGPKYPKRVQCAVCGARIRVLY